MIFKFSLAFLRKKQIRENGEKATKKKKKGLKELCQWFS